MKSAWNPARIGTLAIVALIVLAACGTKVTRMDEDETRDLSGRWNATDSRLVSQEIINDAMAHPWASRHMSDNGSRPVVIVGTVRNRSHEHINVATFVRDIERALINDPDVEVVAAGEERDDLREERADQDLHAAEETRKAMGRELGADYMLQGTLNSIVDQEGRRQVVFYQVDMNLTSLADNRRVWAGQKQIKKYVQRPNARF